jgi:hypothetical protein
MPRGPFTQSAMILFETPPTHDSVALALAAFEPRERTLPDDGGWMGSPRDLLIAFRPGGELAIDVRAEVWPDGMGDPEEAAALFAAWGTGAFGPLVFPGNLERAVQQAHALDDAAGLADKHKAFVRLRTTYAIGQGKDAKLMPDDWDPMQELLALVGVSRALLDVPGALAYFDPNAELLLPKAEIDEALAHADQAQVPPLDLFTHVRFFRIDEGWAVMDTLGMDRFFLPDLEIAFTKSVDPAKAADFLRNVQLYVLKNGPVIEEGHLVDGPEGKLRALKREQGLVEPPRPVIRFVPDGVELPKGLDQ